MADGEGDFGAGSAGAEVAGGHPKEAGGGYVEAAIGVVTGGVDGVGDSGGLGELRAEARGAMGGGVLFWGKAGDGFEDAMKMIGAEAGMGGELGQIGLLVIGSFDEAADLGDLTGMLFGEGRLVGFAPFAGAETSRFRSLSGEMELNVFRACEAGGARWAAIDARGFN